MISWDDVWYAGGHCPHPLQDLGFLAAIYGALQGKDDWENVISWDDVWYAGGLLACFGLGFAEGFCIDRIFIIGAVPASTSHQIAMGTGFVFGIVTKVAVLLAHR